MIFKLIVSTDVSCEFSKVIYKKSFVIFIGNVQMDDSSNSKYDV